jgi:hypothetical protein
MNFEVLWPKRHKNLRAKMALPDMGDCAMLGVIRSRFAEAKLVEKIAWQRYAEAKDDNWREALAKWVEARDETTAAWADEVAEGLHR